MSEVAVRDILTDAIRYWELRRIAYNVILAAVVIAVFLFGLPKSRTALSADLVQALFVLAVLANVAYCTAYIADVAAQYSTFRVTWKRYRWSLFIIGILFAGIITRFIATNMFSPGS